MPRPYPMTLAELRLHCRLLATIEVTGAPSSVQGLRYVRGTEALVGKNAGGEVLIKVKGAITPAKVREFRDSYERAVAVGIIKPATEKEPV